MDSKTDDTTAQPGPIADYKHIGRRVAGRRLTHDSLYDPAYRMTWATMMDSGEGKLHDEPDGLHGSRDESVHDHAAGRPQPPGGIVRQRHRDF